jgi:hypothetical protein
VLPSWIPGELLPVEVEDLTEQLTAGRRGDAGTRNPHYIFADERMELEQTFHLAKALAGMEIPF